MHIAPPDGSTALVKEQFGLCVDIMVDCHITHAG